MWSQKGDAQHAPLHHGQAARLDSPRMGSSLSQKKAVHTTLKVTSLQTSVFSPAKGWNGLLWTGADCTLVAPREWPYVGIVDPGFRVSLPPTLPDSARAAGVSYWSLCL